jgi:hypothetical protein
MSGLFCESACHFPFSIPASMCARATRYKMFWCKCKLCFCNRFCVSCILCIGIVLHVHAWHANNSWSSSLPFCRDHRWGLFGIAAYQVAIVCYVLEMISIGLQLGRMDCGSRFTCDWNLAPAPDESVTCICTKLIAMNSESNKTPSRCLNNISRQVTTPAVPGTVYQMFWISH